MPTVLIRECDGTCTRIGVGSRETERDFTANTVETVEPAASKELLAPSPLAGEGRGEGGRARPIASFAAEARPRSPLSLPSPARGEGELTTGRPLGNDYFNDISTLRRFIDLSHRRGPRALYPNHAAGSSLLVHCEQAFIVSG